MWFRVAAEWKYMLHWLRSCLTSRKYDRERCTSAISLDLGSAHQDESLLKGSGRHIKHVQMHYLYIVTPVEKLVCIKCRGIAVKCLTRRL